MNKLKSLLASILVCMIYFSGYIYSAKVNYQTTGEEIFMLNGYESEKEIEDRLLIVANIYAYVYYFNPTNKLNSNRNRDQFLLDLVKIAIADMQQCDFVSNLNGIISKYTNTAFIKNRNCQDIYSLNDETNSRNKPEEYVYWKHIGPGRDQSRFSRIPGGFKYELVKYKYSDLISDHTIPKADSIYNYELGDNYIIMLKHSVSKYSYKSNLPHIKYEKKDHTLSNYLFRVSNLIFVYSNLKFFQVYPELNKLSIDSALLYAIKRTKNDTDRASFFNTLKTISSNLNDCHATVVDVEANKKWIVPFSIELIENRAVITGVCKPSRTPIEVGDIITKIGDEPIEKIMNKNLEKVSGCSENYKYMVATLTTRSFNNPHPVSLEYIDKDRKVNNTTQEKIRPPVRGIECRKSLYSNFQEIDTNIYYINMCKISSHKLKKSISLLSSSKGIIFDIRGYLTAENIFSHLIDSIIYSDSMIVPISYFPQKDLNKAVDVDLWKITPKTPSMKIIPKVFITNEYALSYSESWMSIIKQNNFGTIIGSNTAACNGNSVLMKLPCNMKFTYTAVKVVTREGKIYQGSGTKPDVYINRTIEEIRQGKDSGILRALEILQGK